MPGGDSPKFLVGDVVRCILNTEDPSYKGGGWILDKEFQVDYVQDGIRSDLYFYVSKKENMMVYQNHLELVSRNGIKLLRHPEEECIGL